MACPTCPQVHEARINIFALIIGFVASIVGYLFRKGFDTLDKFIFDSSNKYSALHFVVSHEPFKGASALLIILTPAVGGLIVGWIATNIAPETKGNGIPNVIKAMIIENGDIKPKVPFWKFVLSIITIGTGGSAGSEGPIAQIGGGIGSFVGQKLKLTSAEKNVLVAAGAGAGITAVFNAPLGGALFGIELLLSSISFRYVIPIILATTTSMATNYFVLGHLEAVFLVPLYYLESPVEFLLFAVLGLIAGLFGVGWQTLLYSTEDFFKSIKSVPTWVKPGLGGILVGMIIYFISFDIRGTSHPLIHKVLLGYMYNETDTRTELLKIALFLLFLAFAKAAATAITLGSGSAGGDLSPALLMGALIGESYGVLLACIFPSIGIKPGLYAILGMAAFFGSVSRAPLTIIIITTEMAGAYELFPALMLTVAIAFVVHYLLMEESIYTEPLLKEYGISIRRRTADEVLSFIPIREVMNPEVIAIYEDTPTKHLLDVFVTYHHQGYVVVSREDHSLKGIITLTDLRKAIILNKMDAPVSEVMTKNVIYVNPFNSVREAVDLMYRHGVGRLPVVIEDEENNKLFAIGMFSRSDLVKTLEATKLGLEVEHKKSIEKIKEKIDKPIIEVVPSKYDHLSDYVVHINYDWISAYLEVTKMNDHFPAHKKQKEEQEKFSQSEKTSSKDENSSTKNKNTDNLS